MVAPYVNPLINFLPINAALDNINDTAVAREKVRATVEAGRRDDSRLDLERQRLAQAAEMNRLEARMKEDELGYRGTQRQLNEQAVRSEIELRRHHGRNYETEAALKEEKAAIERALRGFIQNPQSAPGLPPGNGSAPGGPDTLTGLGGSSFGGEPPAPSPSVPGIVVSDPRGTPVARPTQGVPERPAIMGQPAGRPVPRDIDSGQPQQAVPASPQPMAAPRPPSATNNADPIIHHPLLGSRPVSELSRIAELARLSGRKDFADAIERHIERGKPGKEAIGKIDEEERQAVESLSRMRGIVNKWRPEFNNGAYQTLLSGYSVADRFGVLPKKPQQELGEFAAFKSDVQQNLSLWIKHITGAAMGVDEAKRIVAGQPNMDDGPTEFAAKFKAITEQGQLAIARQRLLRTNQFAGQPWIQDREAVARNLPLETVQEIISRDKRQIVDQARRANPRATPADLDRAVQDGLAKKYGSDLQLTNPPTPGQRPESTAPPQGRVKVKSMEEALKLEPGTPIELPDGRWGTRP